MRGLRQRTAVPGSCKLCPLMRACATAMAVLMLLGCDRGGGEKSAPATTTMVAEPAATDTAAAMAECARRVAAQKEALAGDRLAETETFARHPAVESLSGPPAAVDIRSNRYAREFRTRLRQELAEHGVNFAGAYSLVSVGMTGVGDNWYIVDRRNGKVTLFPYYAAFLDFRKDSNLIVMNPRVSIEQLLREQDVDCYFLNQQEVTSLRSFYFLWKDGRLELLGPKDIVPPRHRFWDEYLGPG